MAVETSSLTMLRMQWTFDSERMLRGLARSARILTMSPFLTLGCESGSSSQNEERA